MELTQLRYFLEVARTEHMTQSAKNLCIVQPALTQSIHKLEDELGVSLFRNQEEISSSRKTGDFFMKGCDRSMKNWCPLPQLLRDSAEKQNNNVTLNVLAASTLITQAIIEYRQDNHDLNIDLIQNEETKAFDICVRTYASYSPALDRIESDETFISSERIFLAVPNTAEYRKQNEISLFDVKEKFIGLYGSKQYRKICNELCESVGFKTNVTFESDNVLAVKEAIAAESASDSGRKSPGGKWITRKSVSWKSPMRISRETLSFPCAATSRTIRTWRRSIDS